MVPQVRVQPCGGAGLSPASGAADLDHDQSDTLRRYERVYANFYRVERCGVVGLSDGGGPFGFDILMALLFEDLVAAFQPDVLVECGSFVGDTTAYLARTYSIPVTSCDIDESYVGITRHRVRGCPHVHVACEPSVEHIASITRTHARPLYFLDAHWGDPWPLKSELETITHGIAIVHDFDINHPRFAFDHYDGVRCDAALLATVYPDGTTFYASNPYADSPFPCLQMGRRTGVAVIPAGEGAHVACNTVAANPRLPLVEASL